MEPEVSIEIVLNKSDLPADAGGKDSGKIELEPQQVPDAPPRQSDAAKAPRPSSVLTEQSASSSNRPRRPLAFLEDIRTRRLGETVCGCV